MMDRSPRAAATHVRGAAPRARVVSRGPAAAVILVCAGLAQGACGSAALEASLGPTVAVDVAALNLDGVGDVVWDVEVVNGAAPPAVVWQKRLSSSGYGDGAGSASYVGPCDADPAVQENTVRVWVVGAYSAPVTSLGVFSSGAVGGAAGSAIAFENPTSVGASLERTVTCLPNVDASVRFDVALARPADQGFFDVAVSFEDIFCSAKLDCEDDAGDDLDLLHTASGERAMTAVLGFACTASPTGSTYLYMDDPRILCAGQAPLEIKVDAAGQGHVDFGQAPSANPGGYLFAASVYRGAEGVAHKAYWSISFGLSAPTFADLGSCRLVGRATASKQALVQQPDGFALPEGTVYPVIDWDVPLSDASGRVCHRHQLNADDSGVATSYVGYLASPNQFTWQASVIYLDNRFEPATGIVLKKTGFSCNPSCARGSCAGVDTCDCTGTGYTGPACETPVCVAPCQHGGVCTAPDTCQCAGTGYEGATCEVDLDECALATDDCDVNATCTNTAGGFACACAAGYSGDGAACSDIDECELGADDCDPTASCTNTPGGFTCTCNGGLAGDGTSCAGVSLPVDTGGDGAGVYSIAAGEHVWLTYFQSRSDAITAASIFAAPEVRRLGQLYTALVILVSGEVEAEVYGAGGGSGRSSIEGGPGGLTSATLDFPSGTTVTVYVGEGGVAINDSPTFGYGAGGFPDFGVCCGGSGGGGSALVVDGVPVLIAGGGGGGGSDRRGGDNGGGGGQGGGATAGHGSDGNGASSTSGGPPTPPYAGGGEATAGTGPNPGDGGDGDYAGGGGGGGYYGGGGGDHSGAGGGSGLVNTAHPTVLVSDAVNTRSYVVGTAPPVGSGYLDGGFGGNWSAPGVSGTGGIQADADSGLRGGHGLVYLRVPGATGTGTGTGTSSLPADDGTSGPGAYAITSGSDIWVSYFPSRSDAQAFSAGLSSPVLQRIGDVSSAFTMTLSGTIHAELYGAGGGSGRNAIEGGPGGLTAANITFPSSTQVTVHLGAGGVAMGAVPTFGFGEGGFPDFNVCCAGSGGGGSALSAAGVPLLVAGGGGGGGSDRRGGDNGGGGGQGGGATAGSGDGTGSGNAATSSSGGAAAPPGSGGGDATAGTGPNPGHGGNGDYAGGGGGGGYYGGGGGDHSSGGGASSFVQPSPPAGIVIAQAQLLRTTVVSRDPPSSSSYRAYSLGSNWNLPAVGGTGGSQGAYDSGTRGGAGLLYISTAP